MKFDFDEPIEEPIGIEEQIDAVRSGHSHRLDLGADSVGHELTEIPEEVFELENLRELILWGQEIRIVPSRITRLTNLTLLDLRYTSVESVPDIPGLMLNWSSYLKVRNEVSPKNVVGLHVALGEDQTGLIPIPEPDQLPSEMLRLSELHCFGIGTEHVVVDVNNEPGPPLEEPPKDILPALDALSGFHSLKELSLSGALFQELPPGVRNLHHLESLYATGVKKLPSWLSELHNLSAVDFALSSFAEFPQVLCDLPRLKKIRLGVWHNGKISVIPEEILDLPSLEHLGLEGHPIETPPPEVVANGVEAIRDYWRQRRDVGVDYLCESKVLIVGEGGAGKTSLAKKLVDPSYSLRSDETSTEGISIGKWHFPFGLNIHEAGNEHISPQKFTANLWDFGGQEIYHATHQFFLSRRSLYLLVTDDRKEDTNFNYWMQVIELLGGDSPLLVVQNEKQDRRRDIDLPTLRSRFSSLKGSYSVNLANNRGLKQLQSAIRKSLEALPHIGTALPKTWISVRQALEADQRHYISAEEYFRICDEHGFSRLEDKLQLSGYLHDLGICLHFQHDPQLKSILFLDPNWATDAVYRVLDDKTIGSAHGRFDHHDLRRIWSESDFAPVRDELSGLMAKFQLCYALPSGRGYIAPALLSSAKPDYSWQDFDYLVVRYEYDFLPKGVIVGAIVALHNLIEDQRLVWRRGMILQRSHTRAEVIEDHTRQEISVRVSGADTRGLLAIIDNQLNLVHSRFPRLRVERYLPCRCDICRTLDDPYTFALNELKDFADTNDKIQCRTSRELVDARELISSVLPGSYEKAHRDYRETKPVHAGVAPEKEVFISYSWEAESSPIVDEIEQAFKECGVKLVRDRNELKYKDPIRSFMKRLGRGKAIIVVLSKSYLESKSCMFELTEIAQNGRLRERVFPIVLDGAGIYDPLNRLQYIKFWETKKKELDEGMKGVGSEFLKGIQDEINLYANIRHTLDSLLEILGDMNALSLAKHKAGGFSEIIRSLD